MSDIEETVKRKDDFSDLVSKLEAATATAAAAMCIAALRAIHYRKVSLQ
jgi:hypothetical protein